jgi:TonB family protein
VAASDSSISIAVVPPDLETLIPTTSTPPKAMIQFGQLYTDLKPKIDVEAEVRQIYQESEVDQVPRALIRTAPSISRDVRGNAATLRAVLILLIDTKGRPENTRIVQSSGNAQFDEIIARTVKEKWLFSPAIRRGKKVKCLAQQAFRVNFTAASPFELR